MFIASLTTFSTGASFVGATCRSFSASAEAVVRMFLDVVDRGCSPIRGAASHIKVVSFDSIDSVGFHFTLP